MQLGVTLSKLSKDYEKQGHSFSYVPLWGTLQRGATPSPPPSGTKFAYSLGTPSPSEFMDDPIHANLKGFSLLLAELYESYFRKEIGAPCIPTVEFQSAISTDEVQVVA